VISRVHTICLVQCLGWIFKTQERKKDVIAKEIPVGDGPGQFLGSYVINRVLTTRLVQWLSWVFTNQKRKKERKISRVCQCAVVPHPRDTYDQFSKKDLLSRTRWSAERRDLRDLRGHPPASMGYSQSDFNKNSYSKHEFMLFAPEQRKRFQCLSHSWHGCGNAGTYRSPNGTRPRRYWVGLHKLGAPILRVPDMRSGVTAHLYSAQLLFSW